MILQCGHEGYNGSGRVKRCKTCREQHSYYKYEKKRPTGTKTQKQIKQELKMAKENQKQAEEREAFELKFGFAKPAKVAGGKKK